LRKFKYLSALAAIGTLALPVTALSQEVEENAVTESDNAFGRKVGNDESGLYSVRDVRGFNPVDAGNVRADGLYIDLVEIAPRELFAGSTVRVGFSAAQYPFPAPTGLIDFNIVRADETPTLNFVADTATNGSRGPSVGMRGHTPLGDSGVGVAGRFSLRDVMRRDGGRHVYFTYGTSARYRDDSGLEAMVLAGGALLDSWEAAPTYYSSGDAPLPEVPPYEFFGQDWAEKQLENQVQGLIVKVPLGDWGVEAGLFRNHAHYDNFYADLFIGVDADGNAARHIVTADRDINRRSYSGELRVLRDFRTGDVQHFVTASLRGRDRRQTFGGGDRVDLGPANVFVEDPRPEPQFTFGEKNVDTSRLISAGLSYSVLWDDFAALDLGLSRSDYQKQVDFADPVLADPETLDQAWLWNAMASISPTDWLSFYVGAATGIEDALIAPDIAVNRAEAPPAIHTRQYEGGVRVRLGDSLTLIAAAFQITKPYYNLDPQFLYRELGEYDNRGIEMSLSGTPLPGLTLVTGAVFLDPTITGEAVDTGLIGPRPVGQPRRHAIASIDWRTRGGAGPLSIDLSIQNYSGSAGNAINSFDSPGYTLIDLGARYRLDLGGTRVIIRPRIENLLNSHHWQISSSGGFRVDTGRTAMVQVTVGI